MKKLIVVGRVNAVEKVYVKFKLEAHAMLVLKDLFLEVGDKAFEDTIGCAPIDQATKWKDEWFPLHGKEYRGELIIGGEYVHLIIYNSLPYYHRKF